MGGGGAGIARSASTEQKRALISPTRAGKKGIHLPQHFSPGHCLIEGPNKKNSQLLLITSGDSCGQIIKKKTCVKCL